MDPLRLALRVFFVYTFLLVLLRLTGKRTIRQGTPFDFVLALILGDLIDDALWTDVPIVQFAVASVTLIAMRFSMTIHRQVGRE